jgi:hypothetical protein
MHSHCRFDSRTASRNAEALRCWRLPDRSKRKKTFNTQRAAKLFEATLVTSSATGETLDPRGRTELESVYQSWIASRPDLSAKVRRGYEDNWRLRIQPRFGIGNWLIAKIDHESIQRWVTVRRLRRRFALRLATVAAFACGRQPSAPGVGVPCPALASCRT